MVLEVQYLNAGFVLYVAVDSKAQASAVRGPGGVGLPLIQGSDGPGRTAIAGDEEHLPQLARRDGREGDLLAVGRPMGQRSRHRWRSELEAFATVEFASPLSSLRISYPSDPLAVAGEINIAGGDATQKG